MELGRFDNFLNEATDKHNRRDGVHYLDKRLKGTETEEKPAEEKPKDETPKGDGIIKKVLKKAGEEITKKYEPPNRYY